MDARWTAPGRLPDTGSAAGATAFAGRVTELEVIARAARRATAGEPSLVVIEGPAGIGKTALVHRAMTRLAGFSAWWAVCDPAEQDWPFSVVEQWLRRADPRLAGGLAEGPALRPDAPPVAVGARLVEALGAAGELGPVLAVVDDVQWVDDASLQALGYMLRRLWADRVMVVVTARTEASGGAGVDGLEGMVAPERAGAWRRLCRGVLPVHELHLEGLLPDDVEQIVGATGLRGAAARSAGRRLWELTDGHPLYLRSVLSADTDQLTGTDATVPVAASLQDAVGRTLARLPSPARALAEALAVLDAQVPIALAGTVGGVDDPAAALEPLITVGLTARPPDRPECPVRLAHPLQRTAVYRAISPARRQDLHASAARVVDTDSAWAHRVAAAPHTDPALADALAAEADRKAEKGYLDRAATMMLWAADLADSREQHEHFLLGAAFHACHVLNPSGLKAVPALRPAVEACVPSALRTVLLSCYAYADGNYQHAVQLGERALGEAQAHTGTDPHVLAAARFRLALYHLVVDHPAPAKALLTRLLEDPTLTVTDTAAVRWLLTLAVLNADGPDALTPLPWMTVLPADPVAVLPADTMLQVSRASAHLAGGRLHAAQDDLTAVLDPERAAGTPPLGRVHALFNLAGCLYLLGDWDQAAACADQALLEGDMDGFNAHHAPAHAWTVFIAAARADWATAEAHLRALRRRPPMPVHASLPHLAEASLAQARQDHTAALRALRSAHPGPATARHRLTAWPDLLFWPMQTQALTDAGDLEEAGLALSRLRILAETVPLPCLEPVTAWCTGRLAEARGDPDTALAAYHAVLDRPTRPDDPPLHLAHLEHAAGQLHLLDPGGRARARQLLDRARQRYDRLGARAYTTIGPPHSWPP